MKHMQARILSFILTITIFLTAFPLVGSLRSSSAAWSSDYKSWSQMDALWGSDLLYTKNMATSGCLVTAIAKLMVHAGQRDPSDFNPGICLSEMKENGFFEETNGMNMGALVANYFSMYAPDLTSVQNSAEFDLALSEQEAVDLFSDYLERDFYIVLMTYTDRSTTHWMTVDRVEDGHVYVMDNDGVKSLYSSVGYSGVWRYMLVKYAGDYTYPAYDGVKKPDSEGNAEQLSRKEVYVVPGSLRVRSGAGLSYSTLLYLNEGDLVEIYDSAVADGYVWGQLDSGGWCAISICTYVSGSLHYIFFDPSGGTYAYAKQQNPINQSVKLLSDQPVRAGYVFLGWSTEAKSQEVVYQPGDKISLDEDVTLYAVWQEEGAVTPSELPDRLEVYRSPDGLRVRSSPSLSATQIGSLQYGESITIYEVQVADGYTWGHLVSGGWCAISICTYVSGSLHFAQFDVGEGSFDVEYQLLPSTQTVYVTEKEPTLSNQVFLGWSLKADRSSLNFKPGDELPTSSDLMLYAVYEEQEHIHAYTTSTVSPTVSEIGYTLYTCSCGESYRSDWVDSKGTASVSAGMLIGSVTLYGQYSERDISFALNGNSIASGMVAISTVSEENYTRISFSIRGSSVQSGSPCTLTVTASDHSHTILFTPDRSLSGYTSSSAAVYDGYLSVILNGNDRWVVGDVITAVSDSGNLYSLKVSQAGEKTVAYTYGFSDQENILVLDDCMAVSVAGATENVQSLSCSSSAYFSAYYQTRSSSAGSGYYDARFIFVGNMKKLAEIDEMSVTITFYLNGTAIRQVKGVLGGSSGTYTLYSAITASGEIYVAADGSSIFGQQITGIPQNAFDNFNLLITNKETGETLLNVSLRS